MFSFLTLRIRSAHAQMLAGVWCSFQGKIYRLFRCIAIHLILVSLICCTVFFRVQWSGCDNEMMVGWLKMRNESEENYLRDFKIAYACKFMMEHCSYDSYFAFLRSAAIFTMMMKWIAKVVRMKMRRWMSAWIGVWARCILALVAWQRRHENMLWLAHTRTLN